MNQCEIFFFLRFASNDSSAEGPARDSLVLQLFVRNLAFSVDDSSLTSAFSEHGEVTFARVAVDRDSGRSRGFGFVSFSDRDQAQAALDKLDNSDFEGRQITVQFATEKPPRRDNDDRGGYGDRDRGGYQSRPRGVCFAFQKGNCRFGNDCRFSHDENDVANAPPPSNYSRGACYAFREGNCTRGDSCRFSHEEGGGGGGGYSERPRGACYAFRDGNCTRGDSCRFSHDGGDDSRKRSRDYDDADDAGGDKKAKVYDDEE